MPLKTIKGITGSFTRTFTRTLKIPSGELER